MPREVVDIAFRDMDIEEKDPYAVKRLHLDTPETRYLNKQLGVHKVNKQDNSKNFKKNLHS